MRWTGAACLESSTKAQFHQHLQELIVFRGFYNSVNITKVCAFLVLLQALAGLMSYFFCSIGLLIGSLPLPNVAS